MALPVELHKLLRQWFPELKHPPQSGDFYIISLKENDMGLWTADLALPPGSAIDSVKQHVHYLSDGVEVEVKTRDLVAGDAPLMSFENLPEGKEAEFHLFDEDDAGNISTTPKVQKGTPLDKEAPPTSGDFTLTFREQPPG